MFLSFGFSLEKVQCRGTLKQVIAEEKTNLGTVRGKKISSEWIRIKRNREIEREREKGWGTES